MMNKANALMRAVPRYFLGNATAISAGLTRENLRRRWRRLMPLLGWPGVVGIGLLALCPLFYFSAVLPMQARLEAAKFIASPAAGMQGNSIGTPNATPSEQLAEYYRFFPGEKDSPKWLGKLVEVGERCGLNLNQGEYAVTQDKVGQLSRFRIALPVEGKYLQIRRFLATLPREIPMLALENVQFERKDIETSEVQAKIRLVLYLGRDS